MALQLHSTTNHRNLFSFITSSFSNWNRIFHLVTPMPTFRCIFGQNTHQINSNIFFSIRLWLTINNYNASWRCDAENQMIKSMANELDSFRTAASLWVLYRLCAFFLRIHTIHWHRSKRYIEMVWPIKTISIAFVLWGGAKRYTYTMVWRLERSPFLSRVWRWRLLPASFAANIRIKLLKLGSFILHNSRFMGFRSRRIG